MAPHERGCGHQAEHSDAAKRGRDVLALHITANPDGCRRKWVAIALGDGSSDGALYDSKLDAITHQHHNEDWYAYFCIPGGGGVNVCEVESFLKVWRAAYKRGVRTYVDRDSPSGGQDIIRPLTNEAASQLWRTFQRALGNPN